MLAGAGELGGLEALIEKLSASGMAIRMVEPEVKALPASDADAVFAALRERVLQSANFSKPAARLRGAGYRGEASRPLSDRDGGAPREPRRQGARHMDRARLERGADGTGGTGPVASGHDAVGQAG